MLLLATGLLAHTQSPGLWVPFSQDTSYKSTSHSVTPSESKTQGTSSPLPKRHCCILPTETVLSPVSFLKSCLHVAFFFCNLFFNAVDGMLLQMCSSTWTAWLNKMKENYPNFQPYCWLIHAKTLPEIRSSSESWSLTQITAVWYWPQLTAIGTCHSAGAGKEMLKKCLGLRKRRKNHGGKNLQMHWSRGNSGDDSSHHPILGQKRNGKRTPLSRGSSWNPPNSYKDPQTPNFFFIESHNPLSWFVNILVQPPPCRAQCSWQRPGWPPECCRNWWLRPNPAFPAPKSPTSTSVMKGWWVMGENSKMEKKELP